MCFWKLLDLELICKHCNQTSLFNTAVLSDCLIIWMIHKEWMGVQGTCRTCLTPALRLIALPLSFSLLQWYLCWSNCMPAGEEGRWRASSGLHHDIRCFSTLPWTWYWWERNWISLPGDWKFNWLVLLWLL